MKLLKSDSSSINFQKELDSLLEKINLLSEKPSLLLHACCGPCSSYVLEYLAKFFKITVYYYNPNIYPQAEYERRLKELKDFYKKFPPVLENKVLFVQEDYNPQEYFDAIHIKEKPKLAEEAEKGERCKSCYEFRLKKAFDYACKKHFDYFCTTLSISPFKDSVKINQIGMELESSFSCKNSSLTQGDKALVQGELVPKGDESLVQGEPVPKGDGPKWLLSDFKKKGGFKRSLEISSEYDLYRQTWCGCIYSHQTD